MILLVLYLFLWQLVAVIWRDLHRPATGEAEKARPVGRLLLISGGPYAHLPSGSAPLHPVTSIGRADDNTIVLGDGFVSAHHARLSFRDDTWWLADLDSRNGTWVNGERITGEVPIRFGDVIEIGQAKLKLGK